jgi:hypothetical protein
MGGVGKLGAAEASLLFPPCPNDPEGFATHSLHHCLSPNRVTKKISQGIPPIQKGVVGKLGAAEASLLFLPCPDDPEGFATEEPRAIVPSYPTRLPCHSSIVPTRVGMR